jgi:hypothetical protein
LGRVKLLSGSCYSEEREDGRKRWRSMTVIEVVGVRKGKARNQNASPPFVALLQAA